MFDTQLRQVLNQALGDIECLEKRIPLICASIRDSAPREELLRAKKDILKAIDIEDAARFSSTERNPGDKMPDGTIYAGISPDTGQEMYTTPADAPLTMRWKQAMNYAAALDAHGHRDWRVPTKRELNILFQNRAAIGDFNNSGSIPAGWYWCSLPSSNYDGWGRRFSDGIQSDHGTNGDSSLRCVRG